VQGDLAVLCVDDELSVLAGLSRQLRRHFSVSIAGSGLEALELIRATPGTFAVIVSDMMMPGMNGAEFLRRSRELSPSSRRVLLTGHTDSASAMAAVNEGGISAFLTKPCAAEVMIETLRENADQFRRTAVERDVLERTVRASVEALAHTLALAAPQVFARVGRAATTVAQLVEGLDAPDGWAIEVALPLSQLGAITLPHDVLDRWIGTAPPDAADRTLMADVVAASLQIIRPIPRLEVVCDIIAGAFPGASKVRPAHRHIGSRIIHVALELESVERRGVSHSTAITQIRSSLDERCRDVLDVLTHRPHAEPSELRLTELDSDMVIARDVESDTGTLLVVHGMRVSNVLITRLQNFAASGVAPARVWVEGPER